MEISKDLFLDIHAKSSTKQRNKDLLLYKDVFTDIYNHGIPLRNALLRLAISHIAIIDDKEKTKELKSLLKITGLNVEKTMCLLFEK